MAPDRGHFFVSHWQVPLGTSLPQVLQSHHFPIRCGGRKNSDARGVSEGEFEMTKLRVNCFSVSIDGYGAGPGQALEHPMGVGGMALHEWVFPTRFFQAMVG